MQIFENNRTKDSSRLVGSCDGDPWDDAFVFIEVGGTTLPGESMETDSSDLTNEKA
jgi:hypothetical protein